MFNEKPVTVPQRIENTSQVIRVIPFKIVLIAAALLLLGFLLGRLFKTDTNKQITSTVSTERELTQESVQQTVTKPTEIQSPDYREEEEKFKAERFEKMKVLSVEDGKYWDEYAFPKSTMSVHLPLGWKHIPEQDTEDSIVFSSTPSHIETKIEVLKGLDNEYERLFLDDLLHLESEKERSTFEVKVLTSDDFLRHQQDDSHCVSTHKNAYNGMYYCVMYFEFPYLPGGSNDSTLIYYFWNDAGDYAEMSFTTYISYGKETYSQREEVLSDDQDKIAIAGSFSFGR